jgi:division protein CdvB (Snf7/Vps24/ESCRT-III family)
MVQAIAANETFLKDAVVERYNFTKLNKTRIRFQIKLKKTTKSNAPKWTDVLFSEGEESDLLKVKTSEVGLKGIKVFKALDEAANQLRQEIASVQEWMTSDNGDWICPIDLAPLVWSQLQNVRDVIAPNLRTQLKDEYEQGLIDYQERIDQFLSLNAWQLSSDKREEVKSNLLKSFPLLSELEDYLQVVIGRPVIIPAISEQLNQQQAECLDQITQFIQQYDSNLEQRLRESAIAGGEQLAAQLLEELADWEPGRKPVQFKKKMEKHLKKVRVLLANASPEAGASLAEMMEHLDSIVNDPAIESKVIGSDGRSQLQQKVDSIYSKLLDEQRNLQELATGDVGLAKATVMSFKFR